MKAKWKEDGLPDALIMTMADVFDLELFITKEIQKDTVAKLSKAMTDHCLSNSHYNCEFVVAMEAAIALVKEATA